VPRFAQACRTCALRSRCTKDVRAVSRLVLQTPISRSTKSITLRANRAGVFEEANNRGFGEG
jgi:hypothetical protein